MVSAPPPSPLPFFQTHRSTCKRLFTSNLGLLSNLRDTQLTHLPFLQSSSSSCLSVKSYSSSTTTTTTTTTTTETKEIELSQQSFVVSYLINSCGLSSERAVYASRTYRLNFTSSKKPDSLLAFLRKHGFTDKYITKLVTYCPGVFICSDKTLSPKFEFFYSIGFTKEDLPSFVCRCDLWRSSLHRCIIPLYELFKDVLGSDEAVVQALKSAAFSFRFSGRKNLKPNLTLLKEVGVPPSNVALLVRNFCNYLVIDSDEFHKVIDEAKALGFTVSKSEFVHAIHALNPGYKNTRSRCFDIYKEYGFSRGDILSAFKKSPQCLLLSERKLRGTLEFLIKKMGCQVKAIVHCPYLFTRSLENTIVPRCSVICVLIQMGLIEKNWSMSTVLISREDYFLDRFVTRHPNISSYLLMVYQRKVDPFDESYVFMGEMEQSQPVSLHG